MQTTRTPTTPPDAPAPRRRRATRVAIPGGRAEVAGEVRLALAGRPDEELVLQALRPADGRALLRLGYRRTGRTIRGPVSAAADEVRALLDLALAEPALAELLAVRPARSRP